MAVDHAAFARAAAKRASLPAGTVFRPRRSPFDGSWFVLDEHNRTVASGLTKAEALAWLPPTIRAKWPR